MIRSRKHEPVSAWSIRRDLRYRVHDRRIRTMSPSGAFVVTTDHPQLGVVVDDEGADDRAIPRAGPRRCQGERSAQGVAAAIGGTHGVLSDGLQQSVRLLGGSQGAVALHSVRMKVRLTASGGSVGSPLFMGKDDADARRLPGQRRIRLPAAGRGSGRQGWTVMLRPAPTGTGWNAR